MGRNFVTRYKAHLHTFRNNNINYEFAQHILENGHAFGTIDDNGY